MLTSRGVVVSDLVEAKELLRIDIPEYEGAWRDLVSGGVAVTCGFARGRELFLGTMIGLARFDLDKGMMEWMWRAG